MCKDTRFYHSTQKKEADLISLSTFKRVSLVRETLPKTTCWNFPESILQDGQDHS